MSGLPNEPAGEPAALQFGLADTRVLFEEGNRGVESIQYNILQYSRDSTPTLTPTANCLSENSQTVYSGKPSVSE